MRNCIRLLDKENGKLFQEYTGHKNADYKVTCMCRIRTKHS